MIRTARLVEPFLHRLELRLELLVLHRQPTVGILEQSLEVLYPLITSQQLALRDTRFLLESRVLVHKLEKLDCSRLSTTQRFNDSENEPYLLLNDCELLQVPLEEGHLLLLGLAVAVADDVVVLLFDFVKLDLELNNLHA